MKDENEIKHDNLVYRLEEKLRNFGYQNIEKFKQYKKGTNIGEIDLLLKSDKGCLFIEVKCNYTKSSLRKARKQYRRYKRIFPEINVLGMYYTGDKLFELD